jgi:hypothetical protein
MKTFTFIDAILSLRPNAKFYPATDFSSIQWVDDTQAKPSETEITAELTRLQAEYDAKQYQRDRAKEYPSIQEQLDMQYWDAVNGTTVWQDTINAIKAKYPKVG